MLTSFERTQLSRFVQLSRGDQLLTLEHAINDPQASGPLVLAMRTVARLCYGTRI